MLCVSTRSTGHGSSEGGHGVGRKNVTDYNNTNGKLLCEVSIHESPASISGRYQFVLTVYFRGVLSRLHKKIRDYRFNIFPAGIFFSPNSSFTGPSLYGLRIRQKRGLYVSLKHG
jgi:hypothetical protein